MKKFRWSQPPLPGLGFYLDDVRLSSANGACNYVTSFELGPPPSGTVIVVH